MANEGHFIDSILDGLEVSEMEDRESRGEDLAVVDPGDYLGVEKHWKLKAH